MNEPRTIEGLLDDLVDAKPILIICAPTVNNDDLQRQWKLVRHDRAEVARREMRLAIVLEDPTGKEVFESADRVATGVLAAALRARLGVGPGAFRTVLCDGEGRPIRHEDEPTDLGPLFDQLDQMRHRKPVPAGR